MEDWLKQVKDRWNVTSDSQWYNSLRTDEKIKEVVTHPETAFHPRVYSLLNKYMQLLRLLYWELMLPLRI